MSRLADALRRAGDADPSVSVFQPTDHSRGDGLWDLERGEVDIPDALPMMISAPASPRRRDGARERYLGGLVERVFLPVSGTPTRSVAFVSSGAEADAGALTATAAELLADRVSGTVCVIDANLRRPSLHEHFGVSNVVGLSQGLECDRPLTECVQRVGPNLWVLPTGSTADASALATAAARSRLKQLASQFDYVLVNAEPVLDHSNAAALLRIVSGVIIVVAADATRRELARRAAQTLTETGVTVIGAVLTNQHSPIPDALSRLL
jgi:Mrp family chromosome partitioning ATPase